MYTCAQCGGAIAGAALVYGVYGRNGAKDQFGSASIANFGMEFILTFLVAFVFFGHTRTARRSADTLRPSLSIGLAYLAALAAYRGSLNPARALGPAFVADAWEYHWVFWVGPILGAACGAFCYTFIFNLNKTAGASSAGHKDVENVSVKSDDDMLDDLERVRYKANMMAKYNEGLNAPTAAGSVYNTAVKPYKRSAMAAESVYGGTKSMYNVPLYDAGARPAGNFDCSRSMYGGIMEDSLQAGSSSARLKRSLSVHSRVPRRNPSDNLPEEPGRSARQLQGEPTDAAGQLYTSDAAYR